MSGFGPFRFDVAAQLLYRGGDLVSIGRRGARLLAVLLERRGAVVSKADLVDAAWPDTAVEESNLSVQVAALRKALGRRDDGGEWIVTVERVGYRFVEEDAASGDHPGLPSLAVLPFTNISGDAAQDYLADGVVEDLTTALARFRSFSVAARNSAFVYKGRAVDVRRAASQLGVRYVLEGSTRRTGERVRIAAQLIDGASGMHIWANTFDGSAEDLFGVQDRIVESVASAVEPRIQQAEMARSRRERPESAAAYDLYLRALSRLQTQMPAENAAAYGLLRDALQIEPDNVMFLASAAEVLQHRISMKWPPVTNDDVTACRDLCHRGLRHADHDAYALSLFGMGLFNVREYELGFETAQRAAELNPNSLMVLLNAGITHLLWGSVEQAEGFFRRSLALNPSDQHQKFVLTGMAHVEMIRRNYTSALEWAQRSLAVNDNYNATYWMLIAASAHLGRMEDARRFLEQCEALAPGTNVASIEPGAPLRDRGAAVIEGLRLAGMRER